MLRAGAAVAGRADDAPRTASFARLCAAGGLAYCSYAMCRSPVLPLFARQLGASPQAIGFLVGASTLTGVCLKLPAGALSDVVGRRALLVAGALVFAALPFAYLPVAALGALVAIRFVHGAATAVFGPVASAVISDLAPASRRGAWLGSYSAIQGAGQAAGPVLAGYLVTRQTFDRSFFASGLIGVAALALVLTWPREPRARPTAARWPQVRQGVREVATDVRILTTSLAQAGQFLLNGTIGGFLPLFAAETLGLSPLRIGIVFGAQTISTLASRPAFGMLSDRVGRRAIITSGLLVCGAALAAMSAASGFASILGAAVVYGAGLAVTTSATSALITDVSARARYGAAHGIFGTIYDIGDASGPIIAGFVVAGLGYRSMFRSLALAAGMLGLAFAWLSRGWSARDAVTRLANEDCKTRQG